MKVARLALFFIVLLITVYIAYKIGFAEYVTLERLQTHSEALRLWVSQHYFVAVISYIVLYALVVAASLPITAPIVMIGGYLFGTMQTVLYATVAATLGATVAFVLFRTVLKATIEQKYASQVVTFRKGLDAHGSYYLLLIHFMFVVPFFLINILAALAGVSLWQFIWTTVVGFLPCAFVYSFAGKKLFSITSFNEVFSWRVIVAILLLILITLLPILYKKYKSNRGVQK